MAEFNLSDFGTYEPKSLDAVAEQDKARAEEAKGVELSDYGHAAAAGAYGVAGSLAGAAQYLGGSEDDGVPARVRDWAKEGAKHQTEEMNPAARRAFESGVLPGEGQHGTFDADVSTTHALGLKITSMLPAMVGALVPGGIVGEAVGGVLGAGAGFAAGAAATGTANAALMGGDVFNQIHDKVLEAPDKDLQSQSEVYRQLRSFGMPEDEAKRHLSEELVGNKPLIMGAIAEATSHLGVAGANAARAAGMPMQGALKGGAATAIEQGVVGAAQSGATDALTQAGNPNDAAQVDVGALVRAATEGGVTGAVMGAGAGAVSHRGGGKAKSETETPRVTVSEGVDPGVAEVVGRDSAPEAPVQNDAPIKSPTGSEAPAPAPDLKSKIDAGLDAAGTGLDAVDQQLEAAGSKGRAVKEKSRKRSKITIADTDPGAEVAIQAKTEAAPVAAAPVIPEQPPVARRPEPVPEPQPEPVLDTTKPQPEAAPVDSSAQAVTSPAPEVRPAETPDVRAQPAQEPALSAPLPEPVSHETLTPQVTPEGPRVLASLPAEAKVKADLEAKAEARGAANEKTAAQDKSGPRISHQEREAIAKGESVAPLSRDEADWGKEADRKRVRKLAEAESVLSQKEGREIAPWAKDILDARGKMRGRGPAAEKGRQQHLRGRRALDELATKTTEDGKTRQTGGQLEEAKASERAKDQAASAKSLVESLPLSPKAVAGDRAAILAHLAELSKRRRELGIELPMDVRAGIDPHIAYLKMAAELHRDLTNPDPQARVGAGRLREFATDDFMIRKGASDEVLAKRQIEGASGQSRAGEEVADKAKSLEEELASAHDDTPDMREGSDRMEADEASATREEAAEQIAAAPEIDKATVAPRREVEVKDGFTAGTNKTGFKLETRRKIAIPGKGEAAKKVSLARSKEETRAPAREQLDHRSEGNDERAVTQQVTAKVGPDEAPSQAQIEAGNYKKVHRKVGGLDIAIENPAGSTRSGVDANGKPWSVKMTDEYGYVKRTTGADGDQVDVFVRRGTRAEHDGAVYVIDQVDPKTGKFDEHKAMVGYQNENDAVERYRRAFTDKKDRIGGVTRMSMDEFKTWLKDGNTKQPLSDPANERVTPQVTERKSPLDMNEAELRQDGYSESDIRRMMRGRAEHAAADEARAERDARDKARVEEIRNRPRQQQEIMGYDPKKHHPIVQEIDAAREWINGLSDADYKTLQHEFVSAGWGFPNYVGNGSEIARVVGEWQRKLAMGDKYTFSGREHADLGVEPVAFMRSDERNRMQRMLEKLGFGREEAEKGAPVWTDPRSGSTMPVKEIGTLTDFLGRVDHSVQGGINELLSPFVAKQLREHVGDVKVHVVSDADMRLYANGMTEGFYEPKTHEIVLNERALSDPKAFQHVVLHEGVHAATLKRVNRDPELRDTIEHLLEVARQELDARGEGHLYGLFDRHEFMAEAFSNREFQEKLASIPANGLGRALDEKHGRPSNLWEWFTFQVRRALGLPKGSETMLDAVMRVGDHVIGRPPEAHAEGARAALRREDITQRVSDHTGALAKAARKVALRTTTLDQIRQNFGHLFPGAEGSHLDTLVGNIQRMAPFAAKKRETGEGFAQRFVDLNRASPEVARASAELRNDLTKAGVHMINGPATREQLLAANPHLGKDSTKGWQAKAHIEDLHQRFMALPADERASMITEAKHYRDTQNEIATKNIENTLDLLPAGTLTDAQRQELIAKTMAGTLGDDERKLLNNTTIFNGLKNAREFRGVDGMYFPLMRHGDHVVRTQDHVEVTHGGKEVAPGLVEFRGTDKDARQRAEKFAGKTDLDVLGTEKIYYEKATGDRLSAADAKGQDVEVAYQVRVQHEGFHAFDSAAEAERFRREALETKAFAKISETMDKADLEAHGDLTSSHLAAIVNSINARTDLSDGHKSMMRTALSQAAARHMTGNRFQQRSLPRKLVQGASTDYARNALRYATASSSYLGKLHYMPAVRESLTAMRKIQKDLMHTGGEQARNQVLNEIERRVNSNVTDLKSPSKPMQDLLTLSYMSKLFGPGHSIINATQPMMVTYPVLAGRHGPARTALELGRAYKDVGAMSVVGQGTRNTGKAVTRWGKAGLDTSDLVASVRKKLGEQKDGAELQRVLDLLTERGALSDGAEFEIGRSVAEGRGAWGTTLAKVDRIARQLPAAIETINRATTAVAAYRLARERMGEEAARQYAFDTTMNTQGDYSAHNAAPMFNTAWARPMMQFKKYAQMMTYVYADMAHRAFKGASREERMVALKQLGTLAAVQIAVAGSLSLPGIEIARAFTMVAGALGIGSGWEDVERKLRKVAADSIGKKPAELLTKGVLTRALGIDLSSRLSLSDMWFFGEPKDYTNSGIAGYVGQQLMGAPGSLALDFAGAARAAGEGDFKGAFIKGFPVKIADDIAKAWKNHEDGKVTTSEAVMTGLTSIKSARLANDQEETGDRIAANKGVKDERAKLQKDYLGAKSAGERAKLTSQIRSFNARAPFRDKLFVKSLDTIRERNATKRRELQGAE